MDGHCRRDQPKSQHVLLSQFLELEQFHGVSGFCFVFAFFFFFLAFLALLKTKGDLRCHAQIHII